MSYAIIETGGKQLRVEPGRFYDVELLHVEPDTDITIDKVLFVQNDGDVTIGQPFIEGATVEGTVMRHRRGKKVIVYKMKPKKKTRRKKGHRQEITQLMINSISMNGSVLFSQQESAQTPVLEDPDTAPYPSELPETPAVEESVAEEPAPVEVIAHAIEEAQEAVGELVEQNPDAEESAPVETLTTSLDEAQEAVETLATEE
ncbi:50S ribosomal protein L21 [Trichocoleus sp. FACHB-69]|nr:50S ribosomal protein L21 [Trichocoleus sp. FACHB-69]